MARRKPKPRFYLILLIFFGLLAGAVFVIARTTKDTTTQFPLVEDIVDVESLENTPAPISTPRPALPENVTVVRHSSADPSAYGFSTTLMVNRKETDSFQRATPVRFPRDTEYTKVPGILTFGGSNYRNSFSYGYTSVTNRRMTRAWEAAVGSIDTWSGTGWTGQPLIICWPEDVRKVLGVSETYKNKDGFTEVIYPAMDGYIYFFDLETGGRTRSPINIQSVMKGTGCLDPNGYPLLYVGDALSVASESGLSSGYLHVVDLIKNEEVYRFGKHDYFSFRDWQAYDSSPMIVDDTLFYAGENGIIYSSKLNTVFDPEEGTVVINPEGLAKYRYSGSGYSRNNAAGTRWYGIESSVAAFREYLFFTDNGGRLQCINANTYKLEYVADVGMDADASVVVEESYDDGTVYLYTASQADVADADKANDLGYTYHKKINGMTGEIVWENKWMASIGDANSNGGTNATPHVGHGNIDGMVIYAMNLVSLDEVPALTQDEPEEGEVAGQQSGALGGMIVAYNTRSGEIMWSVRQEGAGDYVSSPVVVYDENSRAYLIQCDRAGMIKLYDATNGTLLYSLDAGSRIDSTPAVYNQMLVVGTRGRGGSGETSKIICVRIN